MTLDEARETGRNAANVWNKAVVVYRLPGWVPGTWGCIAESRGLPPTAETADRFQPSHLARPADDILAAYADGPLVQGALF